MAQKVEPLARWLLQYDEFVGDGGNSSSGIIEAAHSDCR